MPTIIKVPTWLQDEIRKLPLDSRFKDTLALAQYGSDIWFTDKEVELHTDNTENGKDSIFCVLVNDAGYKFRSFTAVADFPNGLCLRLPVGVIIRHNGRNPHEVFKVDKRRKGRFAVLIWDVPFKKLTADLVNAIKITIKRPAKRNLVEIEFSTV